MHETDLILGVAGLPPQSARNCRQELSPIPNGEFKKSLNGDLLFLASNERRRYRSVISCSDTNVPTIEGIWIGSQINVGCIQYLWQTVNAGERRVRLIRPAVDGSVCPINEVGDTVRFTMVDDGVVALSFPHEERVFVGFRPWLTMLVTNFIFETNEWGLSGSWKLFLEEI
ncbi:MAG: hypothetical protein LBS14_03270 [Holosporaceae bacterium]|jgi:hypothetical protein|nr:hypothetical protein [Holosporaceae bacterium]